MAMMTIPLAFAVVWPTPCGCVPGRTPGYWKHQIKVYMGYTNGEYSWYFDDVKMDDDYMAAILPNVMASSGAATIDEILAALEAKGPGSEAIRNGMNYWLNYWAHLDPANLI